VLTTQYEYLARLEQRINMISKKYLPAARAAKERKLLNGDFIIDHDFGRRELHIQMMNSGRIDCYTIVVDGVVVKNRQGWSNVLAYARKEFPRLMHMLN
jgi:hypothetical protein